MSHRVPRERGQVTNFERLPLDMNFISLSEPIAHGTMDKQAGFSRSVGEISELFFIVHGQPNRDQIKRLTISGL